MSITTSDQKWRAAIEAAEQKSGRQSEELPPNYETAVEEPTRDSKPGDKASSNEDPKNCTHYVDPEPVMKDLVPPKGVVCIHRKAEIYGIVFALESEVRIRSSAQVHGRGIEASIVCLSDYARVTSPIIAHEEIRICGNAQSHGDITTDGNALITSHASVTGNLLVLGTLWVADFARISGDVVVEGDVWVFGKAQVTGRLIVKGKFGKSESALVTSYVKDDDLPCQSW